MAGKRTVLDIVKAVDEKELFEDIVSAKRSRTEMEPSLAGMIPEGEFRTRAKLKESQIRKLKGDVLKEDFPTTGGTYKGSVYYSNILPQDEDKTPWSKKGATLVKNAAQQNAKKSDILAAQNYFVDIGYMHPSEVDGYKGKQLMGMIRRWNLNAGQSKEAMFDAMDAWKDRLFDGGDKEYEEDLREGGGDMGPY